VVTSAIPTQARPRFTSLLAINIRATHPAAAHGLKNRHALGNI
jgi:hypothetical protein